MKINRTAFTLAALMACASVGGALIHPTSASVGNKNTLSLEAAVPKAFGDWTEQSDSGAQVVNPQTRELLNSLYSQQLIRTYRSKTGYRIMLSMAYGDDQRGGLQAHLPDWCYPAQGFKLGRIEDGTLSTAYGSIDVRRLETSLGARKEPVTYWLINGDRVVRNSFEKRIEQIRLSLTGRIPDGLLFRVSSIDDDTPRAFRMQQEFTAAMMAAVSAPARMQLAALQPAAPAKTSH